MPGDEGFYELYENWVRSGQDATLQVAMHERYQNAWLIGELDDKYAVLDFILKTQESQGYSIIIDGIMSNDPGLAEEAVTVASSLVTHGIRAIPDLERALLDFGRRFPESSVLSRYVLGILESPK